MLLVVVISRVKVHRWYTLADGQMVRSVSSLFLDEYCQISSLVLATGYRVTVAMVLCPDGIWNNISPTPMA